MKGIDFGELENVRSFAAAHAICYTREGLVVPCAEEKRSGKIAVTLDEVSTCIKKAAEEGKYILYLPGSYDLVHLGHLSYILQVQSFARQIVGDKKLFTVVLADSDLLIEYVKAYKYVGNGGEEPYKRPIERRHASGEHPRLSALAMFPVDCVAEIPFVGEQDVHLTPLPEDDNSAVRAYNQLYEAISNGVVHDEVLRVWSARSWAIATSLAIHSGYKPGDIVEEPFTATEITRVLSLHDSKYFDEAVEAMKLAGIATVGFDDKVILSTTDLINQYGVEELLKSKATYKK